MMAQRGSGRRQKRKIALHQLSLASIKLSTVNELVNGNYYISCLKTITIYRYYIWLFNFYNPDVTSSLSPPCPSSPSLLSADG